MRCPRCQAQNPEDARFCEECGARLALACPQCGAEIIPGKKFCRSCGAALSAPTPDRPLSPASYTPKHLAEKILTSRSALEGERKQITVLFADLKGSMELLADRDPEEARKLLDPVLERMMDAVHRYEGTVNQVMGDGIMALFGAPVAHEDHAVRACYAALDMQAAIRRHAEQVRRSHGVVIQVRIGLNSGEVVVRAIGSDLRMDYTAVGQTTHLAARMEQLAKPDTTLLTADVLRLAEGFIAVTPLGPVPVKGLPAPIELYEMTGAGPLRSRLHAAAARGLTRFVGREAELEQVRQALGRAAAGHGQVVALVGEPGVGKSRLVWEVTHSHRTHGWLIVQAGSVSYGKATPYLPVIDLLKGYFRIEDRDDPRKVREKVTGKVLTLDETLKPTLPAVLSLLDMPAEDPAWQALDPAQRRQRTLDAVKRLLFRESQVQPLVVVFEDLHWIDSETQALLDSLVESVPTARLLLLVNYRSEYEHRWGSKTYYTQLRLDPLPPKSADELLQTLLGTDAGLQPLIRLLIERTEGNPFFLEESVRTLVETGMLVGDRGAHRLMKAIETIQVPATVQAILAARIDRLAPKEKRLLQTSAVIGKDVPYAVLQAVAEMPEQDLRHGLAHLQAAEFLYETSLFPDVEYTFKHALTHEVAYGSLLQERRRAQHVQIVEAIERRHAGRLGEQVERLAHHALSGELWEKAASYLHQAGRKALGRSSNPEAVAHLEQARAALSRLPETRDTLAAAIDVLLDLRVSLIALADLDRVIGHLREAERLATTLGDPGRLGWVSVYLSHYFWITGHPAEATACAERAGHGARTVGDVRLKVLTNNYLAYAACTAGDYRAATSFCRRMIELLQGEMGRERMGPNFPAVIARAWLAFTLGHTGDFDLGIAHGKEGIRRAEELGQPFSLVHMYWGQGCLYAFKGDLDLARGLLERALAGCREWSVTFMLPFVTWFLGWVYARSGRLAEGLALLEDGQAALQSLGFHVYRSLVDVHLGEASLLAGRPEPARALATAARTLARERGQHGWEACAAHLHGEIAARSDPPDVEAAEDHYRAAMARANALGMRPLMAHCHAGLGRLYGRAGRPGDAREQLRAAVALYRQLDMPLWLDTTEAETRGLR